MVFFFKLKIYNLYMGCLRKAPNKTVPIVSEHSYGYINMQNIFKAHKTLFLKMNTFRKIKTKTASFLEKEDVL